MDSRKAMLTEQAQLDLIHIRSLKASQDFIRLDDTFHTWYDFIDSRDEQAVGLDTASPRGMND